MSKVRDDLVGVVILSNADGTPVTLAAGDEVPEGYTVGEHLLAVQDTDGSDGPARAGRTRKG